jgi:hypothetical protein
MPTYRVSARKVRVALSMVSLALQIGFFITCHFFIDRRKDVFHHPSLKKIGCYLHFEVGGGWG